MSEQESQNEIEEIEFDSEMAGVAGLMGVADGMDAIESAAAAGTISREGLAVGVSDVTRGVDMALVGERAAVLSRAVAGWR
ncbi:MAG: hypothetical protein M5U34_24050 [Chloroflexi bacterium]|nr:hypothetical protein [Chloroflexota bacterium]